MKMGWKDHTVESPATPARSPTSALEGGQGGLSIAPGEAPPSRARFSREPPPEEAQSPAPRRTPNPRPPSRARHPPPSSVPSTVRPSDRRVAAPSAASAALLDLHHLRLFAAPASRRRRGRSTWNTPFTHARRAPPPLATPPSRQPPRPRPPRDLPTTPRFRPAAPHARKPPEKFGRHPYLSPCPRGGLPRKPPASTQSPGIWGCYIKPEM
jgi:hypothetical protein